MIEHALRMIVPVQEGNLLIPVHIAHRCIVSETSKACGYAGRDHVITDCQFRIGRLERTQGDSICKPKDKWEKRGGFYGTPKADPTCMNCRELIKRWGAWFEKMPQGLPVATAPQKDSEE